MILIVTTILGYEITLPILLALIAGTITALGTLVALIANLRQMGRDKPVIKILPEDPVFPAFEEGVGGTPGQKRTVFVACVSVANSGTKPVTILGNPRLLLPLKSEFNQAHSVQVSERDCQDIGLQDSDLLSLSHQVISPGEVKRGFLVFDCSVENVKYGTAQIHYSLPKTYYSDNRLFNTLIGLLDLINDLLATRGIAGTGQRQSRGSPEGDYSARIVSGSDRFSRAIYRGKLSIQDANGVNWRESTLFRDQSLKEIGEYITLRKSR